MFDSFRNSDFARKVGRAMLAADAWVNSTLYDSGQRAKERYANFVGFMDRFHVSGWTKGAVEFACESLTLGAAGLVLLLALAVPAFRDTAEDWRKKQELSVSFLDRFGQPVGHRGIRHDDSVPLEQIPDILVKAALATEDRRFWSHWGVDPIGTLRALGANARASGVRQGGSTITQQLAKNLFLSNERTIERKIREVFLAVWLETRLPKREILKLYLDRAYMGGGNFGVQAASEFYFGKSIRDINLAEAAMLAGLFKAPTRFAPHVDLPAARARANVVLQNLVESGLMTEGEVYAARKNPATAIDRNRDDSPDWYLDWAYEEIKKLSETGKLGSARVLTVRTALDGALQARAQTIVEDTLRQYGKSYRASQAAIVVMEPDGAVRAIIGGRDYGDSQFNRATDALRQPGSSFKPFVYSAALLSGRFKPSTPVTDSPICLGNWCPRNYGGSFAGRVTLADALARSLNTIAVKLSVDIGDGRGAWDKAKSGRAKIIDLARRMGLNTPLNDTVSLPIGAAEVTVIDMASAYAVFASGGRKAPPYAAVEIRNSQGDVIYRRDADGPSRDVVLPPAVVGDMVGMMHRVVEAGTARRAIIPGVPTAGKTGTTNGYKDAWFVGYSGNYVAAVWFGNDNSRPMNNMTGGTLPAQLWHDVMEYAHRGLAIKPLPGGVAVPAPVASADAPAVGGGLGTPQRPVSLSRGSVAALSRIEQLMRARAESMKRVDSGPIQPLGAPQTGKRASLGGGRAATLGAGRSAFVALSPTR